jgi:hypothetical protein
LGDQRGRKERFRVGGRPACARDKILHTILHVTIHHFEVHNGHDIQDRDICVSRASGSWRNLHTSSPQPQSPLHLLQLLDPPVLLLQYVPQLAYHLRLRANDFLLSSHGLLLYLDSLGIRCRDTLVQVNKASRVGYNLRSWRNKRVRRWR